MIHADAIIGDQPQPLARAADQRAVDHVGDGGDEHVAVCHRLRQPIGVHRNVVAVEDRVEQLGHPALGGVGQAPRDRDLGAGGARFLYHDERIGEPGGASQRLKRAGGSR